MLTVLGGLAEFERDLIRAKTGEGRDRAKARRVKVGRKPKLTPHQRREALVGRERGDEFITDIARSYNVSHVLMEFEQNAGATCDSRHSFTRASDLVLLERRAATEGFVAR
jgi:DNA invertase Pin-like site-specific DNA recombinase